MNGRLQEIILIFLLLGLMFISWFWIIPVSTSGFVEPGSGDISSRFVPQMAVLIISLGALLRLLLLYVPTSFANRDPEPLDGLGRRGFIVLASAAAFVILIQITGFYAAGAILVIWLAVFLGERRPKVLLAYPSILISVIFLLFEYVFSIGLPKGYLLSAITAQFS